MKLEIFANSSINSHTCSNNEIQKNIFNFPSTDFWSTHIKKHLYKKIYKKITFDQTFRVRDVQQKGKKI